MADLDFEGLAERLLDRGQELVESWLPGGRMQGHEYICGGITGGAGRSFSVNTETGKWSEFAGMELKGGDLIALYAAVESIGQGEAFKRLSKQLDFNQRPAPAPREPKAKAAINITPPPVGTPDPDWRGAAATWCYRDAQGQAIFWVGRFEGAEGKEIRPQSWDAGQNRWIYHGYPEPRPLYGLELLAQRPSASVMVVEGEKSADAARQILGDKYVVVTWPNGSQAVKKADWSPLNGRKVVIWPDADRKVYGASHAQAGQLLPQDEQPGWRAALQIANKLSPICPEVKVIDPGIDPERKDGWDVADALAEGWTWEWVRDWAIPRIKILKITSPPIEIVPARAAALAPATVTAQAAAQAGPVAAVASVSVDMGDPDEAEGQKQAFEAVWHKLGLAATKAGAVANVDNVLRVIENRDEFNDLVWFDTFHQKYYSRLNMRTWEHETKAHEWDDIDTLNLTIFMQRHLGMTKIHAGLVGEAVRSYGQSNPKNEPQDWLKGLVWDGEERIQGFLGGCFGVEFSDYSQAVSKNWWISMAARICDPGCQVDNMVILEGEQGLFKSRALRLIGGDWYVETKESIMAKDFFVGMQGKLLIIINELDSFRRAEITAIKNVVTTLTDRFRPPYGRNAIDHPRTSVFVATSNKKNKFNDPSGWRRFWPVEVKRINLPLIAEIREQCFAEAYARWQRGEKWHEMPAPNRSDQEERREIDEWEGTIEEWLAPMSGATITEIAKGALGLTNQMLDRRTQERIGECLAVLGWVGKPSRQDGKSVRLYTRGPNAIRPTPEEVQNVKESKGLPGPTAADPVGQGPADI